MLLSILSTNCLRSVLEDKALALHNLGNITRQHNPVDSTEKSTLLAFQGNCAIRTKITRDNKSSGQVNLFNYEGCLINLSLIHIQMCIRDRCIVQPVLYFYSRVGQAVYRFLPYSSKVTIVRLRGGQVISTAIVFLFTTQPPSWQFRPPTRFINLSLRSIGRASSASRNASY